MTQEPDPAADVTGRGRQVHPEHRGPAVDHREESGAQPQERRLARTVRTPHEHDLARTDPEVHPGQGREPVDDGHHTAEVDDGGGVHDGEHRGGRRTRRCTST